MLAWSNMNIATMRVFREDKGGRAVMALELDSVPEDKLLSSLRAMNAFENVTLLKKL